MKVKLPFGLFALIAVLLVLAPSCKKETSSQIAEERSTRLLQQDESRAPGAVAAESDLLKSVRRATSRFHSATQAVNAGYVADDHCVSVPGLGGMGYHWANFSLVDPVFDPLQPEALVYATGPDGNLRLVAVEYIVINAGQPPPMFGGQLFDIGGTPVPAPHWSLHVWLYEENPSGMFKPFNPNITCP